MHCATFELKERFAQFPSTTLSFHPILLSSQAQGWPTKKDCTIFGSKVGLPSIILHFLETNLAVLQGQVKRLACDLKRLDQYQNKETQA